MSFIGHCVRKSVSPKIFTKFAEITPQEAQALALRVGAKGAGFVSPNPLVGCVIVDSQHRFLSSGYHAKYGGPHAEVMALDTLTTDELKNGTMYVTLEPCSHFGKTPPCADRLAQTGLKKVIIGVKDPNPLVSGRGIEQLKKNKIFVEFDTDFTKRSQRLGEHFLWNMQKQLPFVSLKMATSLDGTMALKSGESRWITNESSRQLSRVLRAHHDATLVGARTLIHDDPQLDFRGTPFEGRKANKVVIYDPKGIAGDFLKTSQLLKTHSTENIFWLTSKRQKHLPLHQFEINPQSSFGVEHLKWLHEQKIFSLFVEGGGYTISQFLEQRLFQKVYQFLAPQIIGRGLRWTENFEVQNLTQACQLEISHVKRIKSDILLVGYPVHSS